MELGEPAIPPPSPAPAAAPAAAAAHATPLEQRQWQRLAQRSVRLAVTAFKDSSTRFADASARGTTQATQLSNSLLSQHYMSDLKLPDALRQVAGLQAAAAAKLHRQQLQHLQQLRVLWRDMQAVTQDMRTALDGMIGHLTAAVAWQASLPVFHCLALPESAALLQEVLHMHVQELAVKQDLLRCFAELVVEAGSCLQDSSGAARSNSQVRPSSSSSKTASSSAGSGAARERSVRSVEDCRKLLTGGVTTWMVRPCTDQERLDQLLQLLTDEMAGF